MDDVKKLVIIVVVLAIILFGASFIINKQNEKKYNISSTNSSIDIDNNNTKSNVTNNNAHIVEYANNNLEVEDNSATSESAVIDVNTSNFETEVINSDKKVLIDFYADWCGPCNRLSPIVDKVAKENKDIKVVRIDVDKNESLMTKYNVRSIPTLVVIENGKEINRSVGLIPEDSILTLIGK